MASLRKTLSSVATALILLLGTKAQVLQDSGRLRVAPTPSHGVMVESVMGESEAERNGIKPGDVIDGWSRDSQHGAIASPFDFTWVEIEQKPRGPLNLEGLRGTERQSWKFATDQFGLKVRPVMREPIANAYDEGNALAKSGKLTEAVDSWKRAAAATTSEDPAWLASWLLTDAAEALSRVARAKEASPLYEEAVQRCPREQPLSRSQILMLWAVSARTNAEFDKSETLFTAALEQSVQGGARSLLAAKALEGIALSAYIRDDLVRMEEYMKRSLDIRQELAPESSAVASSLLWMGSMAQSKGDLSAGQRLFERASEIDSRLAPISPDMAEISNSLGMVAKQRGDLDHAETWTEKTLVIGEKLGRPKGGTAAMLVNLGAIAQARGDFPAAERYLRESLAIMNEIDPESPIIAAAHNNLGSVLVDENKFDEGEEHLKKALTLKKKRSASSLSVASTLAEMGRLAFKRNNLNLAADYLEQALAIKKRAIPESVHTAETLADLAATRLRAGDLANAELNYNEAAKFREKLAPESAGYGEVLAGLASIRLRQGKTDEASSLYGKAIHVLESQMSQLGGGSEARSIFRVRNANYYRDYVALLIEQGNPELALDYL